MMGNGVICSILEGDKMNAVRISWVNEVHLLVMGKLLLPDIYNTVWKRLIYFYFRELKFLLTRNSETRVK